MGLIRTGERNGVDVVLFGKFALPAGLVVSVFMALYALVLFGCIGWDATGHGPEGITTFVIFNAVLLLAFLLSFVGRIFRGVVSYWHLIKSLNGYGPKRNGEGY